MLVDDSVENNLHLEEVATNVVNTTKTVSTIKNAIAIKIANTMKFAIATTIAIATAIVNTAKQQNHKPCWSSMFSPFTDTASLVFISILLKCSVNFWSLAQCN